MSSNSCPDCCQDNHPDNRFCIHCGSELMLGRVEEELSPQASGTEGVPDSVEDSVENLRREVTQLRHEVAGLRQSLHSITRSHGEANRVPRRGVSPSVGNTPTGRRQLDPRFSSSPSEVVTGGSLLGAWTQILRWDWEQMPGNWFARVGGLTLMMGVGFFLALAFDNDWIGPKGQVALGIAGGALLLAVGEYWRKQYRMWAQAVTGTGIAILYLSIFAAFSIHDVLESIPSFVILVLITLTGGVLALRYHALALAILATLGGLVTPIILERDLPNVWLLLPYILILDLGVMVLVALRNWRWLTLIGAGGSYGLFGVYVDRSPGAEVALEQAGLALIFLIFVGATTLFHLVWRKTPRYTDLLLMTANGAAYFSITAALLHTEYEGWLPLVALSLVLLYGLVAYASLLRRGGSAQLTIFALATALIFLTIAVPLQLSGEWITIAWAAEGATLIGVGFLLKNRNIRAFGLAVFPIVIIRLMFFDTPVDPGEFKLILNTRFLTFVAAIVSIYIGVYLYWCYRSLAEDWEVYNVPLLLALANFFSLWILSAEVIRYFDSRTFTFDTDSAIHLSLTLMWALYAVIGLVAGAFATSQKVRLAALGLLAIAVIKLFVVDSSVLGGGYRVTAFISLGFLLIIIGFLYQRYRGALTEFFLGRG